MKRILYLTFYFRPDLCAGSFRNSPLVDELAEQTKNRDIKVDVITTSPNRYSTFREEYEEKETIGHLTIERVVIPSHESGIKDQMFSFKTFFYEALKRTKNREYDLVFASSSRFFTSYLGYWIAKKKRIPLYLDVRDLFSEALRSVSDNLFIKRLVVPAVALLERKVYRYASHINLISEGFKENFTGYTTTTFSYFTHGVDPLFKKARIPKKKNRSRFIQKIVYAGNIGDGQGLDVIIPEAAKQIDDFYTFTLIGDGGARKKLENRLRQLDVKNVRLLAPVSRMEVLEEYEKADILFIHLNDLEIFQKVLPSKIFELAALEKPILAGVSGFAKKFLEENLEGIFLFDPGDTEGLVRQIREIEKSDGKLKEIDHSEFIKKYDRKEIDRKMVASILDYL